MEGEPPIFRGGGGDGSHPQPHDFPTGHGLRAILRQGDIHPPQRHDGVDALRTAWAACPADCTLLVMGDLNINFEHPRDAREEDIADLLDEINLVDSSRKFPLWRCKLQSAKKRWTWRQRRTGRWHHAQPDYILAREGGIRRLHFGRLGYTILTIELSSRRFGKGKASS